MSDAGFAITFRERGDAALQPLLRWIAATLHHVTWVIDLVEATYEQPDEGAEAPSSQLPHWFPSQVIELEMDGHEAGVLRWRVIVRDGFSVDLLGFGSPPSPEVLGLTYEHTDPTHYYW